VVGERGRRDGDDGEQGQGSAMRNVRDTEGPPEVESGPQASGLS
jgi:hypothetical protein